ncbi:hypothetical protein [Microbacterium elymi]|uniref:Uncharacterized protein n=1 Tax=Microbacterium elymi TaxID=2909587 RepID=A0ABY5NKD2_9MICO|nr:hypothetical protein [Microbacterium elymi]UUT35638.1 hypothetical protein L2X98_20395 [Microbacterium elymi]
MSETAPDAATLLDEAGTATEWVPFDHRPRTAGRMTVGVAAHGDWQAADACASRAPARSPA